MINPHDPTNLAPPDLLGALQDSIATELGVIGPGPEDIP